MTYRQPAALPATDANKRTLFDIINDAYGHWQTNTFDAQHDPCQAFYGGFLSSLTLRDGQVTNAVTELLEARAEIAELRAEVSRLSGAAK